MDWSWYVLILSAGADTGHLVDLRLREVSFSVEFIRAWEHGNPKPLCIVRFTQERGAASSLREVVRTIRGVFADRELILTNKQMAKRMIKTLNS